MEIPGIIIVVRVVFHEKKNIHKFFEMNVYVNYE